MSLDAIRLDVDQGTARGRMRAMRGITCCEVVSRKGQYDAIWHLPGCFHKSTLRILHSKHGHFLGDPKAADD